jgi:hypothetical protein
MVKKALHPERKYVPVMVTVIDEPAIAEEGEILVITGAAGAERGILGYIAALQNQVI